MTNQDEGSATNPVQRVYGRVTLIPQLEREELLERTRDHSSPTVYAQRLADIRSPEGVHVCVKLSVECATRHKIEGQGELRIGMPRHGLRELENKINMLLGRDPTLHRPPHPAWDGLIAALQHLGIYVSEEQLSAADLVLEVEDDVQTQLNCPTDP